MIYIRCLILSISFCQSVKKGFINATPAKVRDFLNESLRIFRYSDVLNPTVSLTKDTAFLVFF